MSLVLVAGEPVIRRIREHIEDSAGSGPTAPIGGRRGGDHEKRPSLDEGWFDSRPFFYVFLLPWSTVCYTLP